MDSKKLARAIKKIVREEVQKEVRKLLLTNNNQTQTNQRHERVQDKMFTENSSLNEALNATINEQEEWKTVGNFNSTDARSQFASMQTGFDPQPQAPVMEDLNGRAINPASVDKSVSDAMTRDYSELVKRFKK